MAISLSELMKATRLTRRGRLLDAMRVIQRAIGTAEPPRAGAAWHAPRKRGRPARLRGYEAEVAEFRERHGVPFRSGDVPPVSSPRPVEAPVRLAAYAAHTFTFAGERHVYRLFIPSVAAGLQAQPLPLLVMLHGCRQDAADFARGTGMNALAEQRKCIVLYPEQRIRSNELRCWNWFEAAHQGRDEGEPGMIAALTRHVIESQRADASRVYVAGLSAGGAMAVQVAALYPDLFAAVGVHSGLPSGAARDLVSAFGAMRGERRPSRVPGGKMPAMPTIVFHGDADTTVHPDNGDRIADAALEALRSSGAALERSQHAEAPAGGRRGAVRTVHASAEGKPYVEHWAVGSGPHAWSGGDSGGSYTDPKGPHASRAILDFLLQHRRDGS